MLAINYIAFTISKPTGGTFAGVLAEGSTIVEIAMDGCHEVIKFEHLGEICARRGWSFSIETSTHLFQNSFADQEVGLEDVRREAGGS